MSRVEANLREARLELPPAPEPAANYLPAVRTGNLLFVSGQGPTRNGTPVIRGLVGDAVSEAEAVEAAQLCALNSLAVIKATIDDLDRVVRVVKLLGFVASADDFERQPLVMNGASDLYVTAFGEAGRHARSAIGTSKLPFDIPVEVEIAVELPPE